MSIDQKIANLPVNEQAEILELINRLETARAKENATKHFLSFVKYLWPAFIDGNHFHLISEKFDKIVDGKMHRAIINMPPRHGKSEMSSIYLPAYFLGKYPDKKVIQASHTAELAVNFGRKVRNIINSKEYQEIFPGVTLSQDSKAAGRWATNKGGEYFAIGVGGAVAGKGADLFIIDDPISEQDAILGQYNASVHDKVMDWYESGPRQRLQPGGRILLLQTRWSVRDLTGQLLKKQSSSEYSDQWDVLELPALLPSGNPIWPEFWKTEQLLATKASISVPWWNAQYQQQPTAEEGALIKREYWRDWEKEKPPQVEAVIQSWDTAFSKGTRSDYSACTTWGVFFNEEEGRNQVILLDAQRGKWEFPELKSKALELFREHEPDICLIEARAAGMPLIYEMRRMGLPIQDVNIARGTIANPNDKISRVNTITDVFASGNVWAPRNKMWAQEVIEECAAFPAGEHDDYLDTVAMAITRFRHGGWVATSFDEKEDKDVYQKPVNYY